MSFDDLPLLDEIRTQLGGFGYREPTPIQFKALPVINQGRDLLAEAHTGTGKTATFAWPILKMIAQHPPKKKKVSVLALVIAPTRELALQVGAAFEHYAKGMDEPLKMAVIIGGEDIRSQTRALRHGVDLVVATPGRLLDFAKQGEIRLFELKMFVIDEADKMLDLGFKDELAELFTKLPKKRQSLFFSATLPKKVIHLSHELLTDPVKISTIDIHSKELTAETIEQKAILVDKNRRRALLEHLVKSQKWAHAIVFVASKRLARNISQKLKRDGLNVIAFHGDLKQEERVKVLKRFKNREIRILIATDIAARGIDVSKLTHVVNYDLPRAPLDYIHRIGRTGRAGESGVALSFVHEENIEHFKLIKKRTNISLKFETVEGFEPENTIVRIPKTRPQKKRNYGVLS
jgi:superfamily II DNA/RNA helicase